MQSFRFNCALSLVEDSTENNELPKTVHFTLWYQVHESTVLQWLSGESGRRLKLCDWAWLESSHIIFARSMPNTRCKATQLAGYVTVDGLEVHGSILSIVECPFGHAPFVATLQ